MTPSVVIESLTGKDYDSSGRSDWNGRMMNDGNDDNDDKPGKSETFILTTKFSMNFLFLRWRRPGLQSERPGNVWTAERQSDDGQSGQALGIFSSLVEKQVKLRLTKTSRGKRHLVKLFYTL